jgi:DNA-binding MarR family transcriptional regulator
MGELVAELVDAGWLERVPDPDDGRARLIRQTRRGRAELTRAHDELVLLTERWQQAVGPRTAAATLAALAELVRICDEHATPTRPADLA